MLPRGSITRESKKELEEVPRSLGLRAAVAIGLAAVFGGIQAVTSGSTIGILVGAGVFVGIAVLIFVGWREHVPTFLAFIRKKSIWGMLIFVFLYRTGEGFLLVEAPLFMQAPLEKGGLGLTLIQKGAIDGLVSTLISLAAGVLAGEVISRYGLKRMLLPLAFFMNVPHLCYVYLSQAVSPAHPLSMTTIAILVTIEKFGYSFGFTGNMVYMMQQIAPGKFKMTHYAYATALMNLVLIPTQSASGPLADWLGYKAFFIFVLVASIPSIIAAWFAPFPDPPEVEDSEDEPRPTDLTKEDAKPAAA
jgi:PAT family beta-lactamase induction signal transducer AmpG